MDPAVSIRMSHTRTFSTGSTTNGLSSSSACASYAIETRGMGGALLGRTCSMPCSAPSSRFSAAEDAPRSSLDDASAAAGSFDASPLSPPQGHGAAASTSVDDTSLSGSCSTLSLTFMTLLSGRSKSNSFWNLRSFQDKCMSSPPGHMQQEGKTVPFESDMTSHTSCSSLLPSAGAGGARGAALPRRSPARGAAGGGGRPPGPGSHAGGAAARCVGPRRCAPLPRAPHRAPRLSSTFRGRHWLAPPGRRRSGARSCARSSPPPRRRRRRPRRSTCCARTSCAWSSAAASGRWPR